MINYLEKNKILSTTFLLLIAIEIFYFSSLSFSDKPQITTIDLIPTAYHFIVFFLFAFFTLAIIKGTKKIKINYAIIAFLFSVVYAISDEVHQIFVPNRFSSFEDILIDSLGILFSILIYTFIDYKKSSKEIY